MIYLKEKIAPQNWIDWKYIEQRKHHFLRVHHICESMGLAKIMEFKHYYNERVIMQFYATLFIEEEDGVKKFVWKIGGK